MTTQTAPKTDLLQSLARFDLRGCEYVGRVLFATEPDRFIEDRFFVGWRNILSPALQRLAKQKTSSTLQIVEDQGRRVLEWPEVIPCLVANGNAFWADCEIACDIRCVMLHCAEYDHDEMTFDHEGRTGVALRIQDSRRHYFAGFQAGRKLVIAARDDSKWVVLARADFEVDQRRYYQLGASCNGNEISVSVDGTKMLSAKDDRWDNGAAGLYTTVLSRYASAEIRCTSEEKRAIASRQENEEKVLAGMRSKVPQPHVALELKLPAKADNASFGCAIRTDQPLLIVDWSDAKDRELAAIDLKGRVVWQQRFLSPSEFFYESDDIDNDGSPEIVLLAGDRMFILDGRTGKTRFESDYPEGSPFFHFRGSKARFNNKCPKIWRTGRTGEPARIYLFEYTGAGGHTIWSYDHQLRQRWVHHNYCGKYGHDLTHYDVDGDGRNEIVAGYYTLNDEGEYVWRIEDQDMIYKQEHTDNLWVGPMGDARSVPKIIAVAGEAGVLFLDARSGNLLKRLNGIGHMQRIAVGRFRHDLGGQQAWVWTDWGSPGIYYLLDENGNVLQRFQPDARCTDGQTVTWGPDGRQFLLLRATPDVRGLWSSAGLKVVDLSMHMTRAEVAVARVTSTDTDQFVTIEGNRLRVIGPKS